MRSVVIIAALALLMVSCVCAEPYVSVWGEEAAAMGSTSSWFGSTGLIITPSAFTLPRGAVTVGGHWVNTDPDSVVAVNGNYGLTEHIEVGGAWIDPAVGDSEGIFNVKGRLPLAKWLEEEDIPEVAIGSFDLTDEINRAWYVVVSKSLPLNLSEVEATRINLHLGFASNESDSGSLDGLFAGVEFSAFRRGVVQAEYDGDNFNADFRYAVSDALSLDIGILDGDLGLGGTYHSKF